MTHALPVVDISEGPAKAAPVIREACLAHGFFYCVGHGIDPGLQSSVFAEAAAFFDRPMEEKLKADKAQSSANRGYEPLRGQVLEPGAPPDLKEGYYIGEDLPPDDSRAAFFNAGPNVWPEGGPSFRTTMETYYVAMLGLCRRLLAGVALSLNLPEDHFQAFAAEATATLRLLHYPPQPAQPKPGEKGCGAHTDFGAITLLLQDQVGGLQVFDQATGGWIEATPLAGAYVVNLGDLIARWTNDRYRSTLHRVINASGRERYSVPFFFVGNPTTRIVPLPGCLDPGEAALYPPVTVDGHIRERYAQTYGR